MAQTRPPVEPSAILENIASDCYARQQICSKPQEEILQNPSAVLAAFGQMTSLASLSPFFCHWPMTIS
jgi:hypothetical protein